MVYLVYGSPCSGKSTYVREHAKDGDVICDVDLIFEAISTRDAHDSDLYVHEIALELRKRLLDIIHDREMKFGNAWVISTANTLGKLRNIERWIDPDEIIFIDTPKDVCLKRADERPKYFKDVIEIWFKTKAI